MAPHDQCCHNPACWAYGRRGEGHIVIHSQRERRYRCKRCAKTFRATKGTALYRAHTPHALVMQVVTLLAHGCPPQAIVAAFGLDERTVARYQAAAGAQCRRVPEHVVQAGRVALGQVQADELRVRVTGGVLWVATALAVGSRLWLGGTVSAHRDKVLIRQLLERVRACGPARAVLLCVDGLSSYVTQARAVFREAQRTGRGGRPRLVLPSGVCIAQVVKRYARRRVVGVAVINTAYVERFNATFRARPPSMPGCGSWALLQLLLGAAQPASAARRRCPTGGQVGRAHAGASGQPDRSLLVAPRTPDRQGAAATGQTAGPPAPLVAGGGPCRLTTVPWGAT